MRETYRVPAPPPRSSDPVAGDDRLRTYQLWKGSNVFFLGGRLIFGPDARSVLLTIFLIVAPVAVFCVLVAGKLIDDFAGDWGVSIIVVLLVLTSLDLILLLLTSGRDPGIIPRNAHPPEPEGYEGHSEVTNGQTPPFRLPRTKDVIVNGIVVKTKYCDTCMLYRPPRCSHCSICNNCVERFDHHCPWVGQCIGQRNYRFFFMFVFLATIICLYVHGFCWVYIKKIMNSEDSTLWKAMAKTPASIVLVVYSFVSVWFVGGLTVFHLYLISNNQSTYENFRYRYDGLPNPYDRGLFKNLTEIFCSSIPPSKNNFRAKVQKEPVIQPRTVGSYINSSVEKSVGDIEMGRKPVWDDESGREVDDNDRAVRNDDSLDEEGGMPDVSPDLSRILPPQGLEGRSVLHSRRSSLGRKSGSWEISPDVVALAAGVGESRRVTGANLTSETFQSQTDTKL
ncbi:DHHC-type zinc finger family protein [Euphorbia peplus]|nr:DHHC-type zinc finger family protein [Euphorbia peplus]